MINKKNIDLWVLLSIVIVAGLIAGRIETTVFSFLRRIYSNGTQGQKIFLTILFLILCIPCLQMNPENRSPLENRSLQKRPNLILQDETGENGLFLKYGKIFDFWFNDRFWGRLEALSFYHFLQKNLRLRLKMPKGFVGQDKNLFQTRDTEIFNNNYIARLKKYTNRLAKNLKKLRLWAERNNIKIYLVIVPVKESILYNKLGKGVPADTREYDRWIQKLKKKSGLNVIYPKKILLQAAKNSKELLFFKQDHHYTEYGMFFIYQELMKRIKQDFPDISVLSEDDFSVYYDNYVRHGYDLSDVQKLADLCSVLMIFNPEECHTYTQPYRYYQYRDFEKVKLKRLREKITRYFNSDGKYNLYLLGTSHVNQLSSFLPFSFKYMVKEVGEDSDITKKNVLFHKPDIMVLVLQTTVFDKLDNLFKE